MMTMIMNQISNWRNARGKFFKKIRWQFFNQVFHKVDSGYIYFIACLCGSLVSNENKLLLVSIF